MPKINSLDCILLIDDDEATNYINRMVIKQWDADIHVEVCESGQIGLDYLTSKGRYSTQDKFPQPGVVFLDINMPGMSGWDFLEAYKDLRDDQKAKVVVAMLTTSLNIDDKERSTHFHDLQSFYNKPLTVDMVKEIVEDNFDL